MNNVSAINMCLFFCIKLHSPVHIEVAIRLVRQAQPTKIWPSHASCKVGTASASWQDLAHHSTARGTGMGCAERPMGYLNNFFSKKYIVYVNIY